MKKSSIVFAFLLVALSLVSCMKNSVTNAVAPTTRLWNLQAGSSWTYVDSFFTTTGTVSRIDTATVSCTTSVGLYSNIEYYTIQDSDSDSAWWLNSKPSGNITVGIDTSNRYILMSSAGYLYIYPTYSENNQEQVLASWTSSDQTGTFTVDGYSNYFTFGSYQALFNETYFELADGTPYSLVQLYLVPGYGPIRIVYYRYSSSSSGYVKKATRTYLF